jgi:hypothetical protein
MTPACPRCRRPIATSQPRCLYCGGALSEALQADARAAASAILAPVPVATAVERAFVVVDIAGVEPAALARALGVTGFEAEQRRRRGGIQLERRLPDAEAREHAARLAEAGIRAFVIPEAATRAARTPRLAQGGAPVEGALRLRCDEGPVSLRGTDLRLVVRGPIAREYQSRGAARHQVRTAVLEGGYRFHLHSREGPPIEIDPWSFELGAGARGSSLLTLNSWLATLAAGAPVDDGFRWLTPALAPSLALARGALRAAEALRRKEHEGVAPVVLDNVEQFRWYSGWRGAFEAQLSGAND